MDPLTSDPPHTTDPEPPAVWGAVTTLLWTVLIAIVFVIVQIVAAGIYVVVTMSRLPQAQAKLALAALKFDGLFLSVCTLATLLVCTPLIVGVVKLKRGSRLKDYLGLKVPRLRQLLGWTIIIIVFGVLVDLILTLLHQPKTSEFMLKVYSSTDPRWPLWLAVVIAAPVFEEIAFRGFIFKGLAASRLRWSGATLITALLWAAIHSQYDWYQVSVIFALGLVFGTARALTNSTLLTIWLHCFVNILASIQIESVLQKIPVNH